MLTGIVGATVLGGLLFTSQPTEATAWVANSPESLSIRSGQTSYTLKLGDTLWAISQRTNLTIQTLADVNNINLSLGEQYNLPIGRTIYFDGNKVTVKEANGSFVKEVIMTDDNKVDTSKDIGEPVIGGNQTPSPELPTNDGTKIPVVPEGPTSPGNDSDETSTDPEIPETPGNSGGETPTNPEVPVTPENPGDGGTETPTDPEIPEEKVYRGETIPGVNNGAVGTWTNKDEMIAYIEANWTANTANGTWTDNYVTTTNGYGWIAMFY